jgi:alpha-N-arabinofuranosidase
MKMYNVHQDATYLPVSFASNDYEFESKKIPAISISASKSTDATVHISIVNIDLKKSSTINLNIRGVKYKTVSGTILSSAEVQDHNTFSAPDKIKPKEFKAIKTNRDLLKVEMPPFSVVVLEFK